jgi:hypothetical protein
LVDFIGVHLEKQKTKRPERDGSDQAEDGQSQVLAEVDEGPGGHGLGHGHDKQRILDDGVVVG